MTSTDLKGTGGTDRSGEWFRRAFDEFYLHLYAHRDLAEAAGLVESLDRRYGLAGPVLDIACGPGRFLRALSDRGRIGFGVDLSDPLLRQARRGAPASGLRLARADMRRLPVRSRSVDWTVLLFTSFGYFEREQEDRAVLEEAWRVLSPGGRIVLDFLNAERTAGSLVPQSRRRVAGREVRETRWIDPSGPFLRKRVEAGPAQDGEEGWTYVERVRLYSPEELSSLLRAAGFRRIDLSGDYGGAPFAPAASERCILVGRKPDPV